MGIIKELIDELSQSKTPLTDILIRSKVLAHRLKNEKIKDWINDELNGYQSEELPNYRILPCRVMGSVNNGIINRKNIPLPLYHLEKGIKDVLEKIHLYQSISTLEEISKNHDSEVISRVIPIELYNHISSVFSDGFVVEYAQCEVSRIQIIQVLTSIRSKLLDFLMDIDDIVEDENSINPTEIEQAKSMFNSAVFGDNATIIVGNHNQQKVTNHINKGNFNELEKILKDNGVADADIEELKTVIDTETPDDNAKTFGSKVNEWTKKMLGKAVDGTWKVGIAVAGKLIADALWAYYGVE